MMDEKLSLRRLFLLSFVEKIVSKINPAPIEKKEDNPEKESYLPDYETPEEYEPSVNRVSIVPPGLQKIDFSKKVPQRFPVPQKNLSLAKPAQGYPDLGKLNILMTDPRINSIECSGPNQNITVKKDGLIQKTPISLTAEEIKKIINDFSERTRIPLIGGTFKAVSSNLMMTAVVSEYVGSKFILQKRNPFQPYG